MVGESSVAQIGNDRKVLGDACRVAIMVILYWGRRGLFCAALRVVQASLLVLTGKPLLSQERPRTPKMSTLCIFIIDSYLIAKLQFVNTMQYAFCLDVS